MSRMLKAVVEGCGRKDRWGWATHCNAFSKLIPDGCGLLRCKGGDCLAVLWGDGLGLPGYSHQFPEELQHHGTVLVHLMRHAIWSWCQGSLVYHKINFRPFGRRSIKPEDWLSETRHMLVPSGVFSGSHNWVLVCSSRSCWVAAFCYFSPPVDFYTY